MREGRLAAELTREQATEEAIIAAGTTAPRRRPPQPRGAARERDRANPRLVPAAVDEAQAGMNARRWSTSYCAPGRSGSSAILALFVLVTSLIQPRFLSAANIQLHPRRRDDLRARRGRRDVRRADAQRRPLGRVGRRPVGLRLGEHVPDPPRHRDSARVRWSASASASRVGSSTGAITAVGACPSLVVTLAMLYIIRGVRHDHRRQRSGRGQLGAELVHQHLPRDHPRDPRPRDGGRDRGRDCGLLPALVPLGTRPVRDRIRSRPPRAWPGSRSPSACSRRFVLSGAIAGLGGVIWATQYNTIDATAANGLELQIIAAVVVGGVAIFGGSGSVVGAALGALLLQTINVGAQRARDPLALDRGDRRLPAARRDHARSRHPAAARGGASQAEGPPWRLSGDRSTQPRTDRRRRVCPTSGRRAPPVRVRCGGSRRSWSRSSACSSSELGSRSEFTEQLQPVHPRARTSATSRSWRCR